MAEHPIESIMTTTMENLKEMIDVNTIVGDAVETSNGTVIIPISKVSFGFVSGGGEYKDSVVDASTQKNASKNLVSSNKEATNDMPFAGGSGAGVTVNPTAFLVVSDDKVKLLLTQFSNTLDRVVDLVPQVIDEIQSMIGNNKGQDGQSTITKKETIITENISQ